MTISQTNLRGPAPMVCALSIAENACSNKHGACWPRARRAFTIDS